MRFFQYTHSKSRRIDKKKAWSFQTKGGVGPSLHHYRCVQVYVPASHSVITADTVKIILEKVPFPNSSLDEFILITKQRRLMYTQPCNLSNQKHGTCNGTGYVRDYNKETSLLHGKKEVQIKRTNFQIITHLPIMLWVQ